MDVPRKSSATKRRIRRIAYIITLVAAVGGITIAVSRLKPAAQTIDRQTVWIDTVKRGEMLRQVRGLGTLVPEEIRWIPAQTQGRVERRLVKPGEVVRADSVIIELSNPELQRDVIDAESQLRAAEAEYKSLRVRLESQLLDQKAAAATVRADYNTAKFQSEVNEGLAKQGLVPENNVKLSKIRAEELEVRNQIEQQRVDISAENVKAQLDVQKARVEQLKALYDLRRSQLDSLRVRSGIEGVLQQMIVEVGQQVTPGQNLARVSNPHRLKAELRIAETQAKDVQIGQPVSIDTRNGIIPGRVSRKDPGAQNGTVTVDAELLGELPRGAVPDLSVDGTIELERLTNVLYVGRPVHGQESSVVGLFKLEEQGKSAVRIQVRLGRSSVNTIEIIEGLREGDQVILSDTSAWDSADRINLN
ncbi:MAG TPA: HlyD family efflux transporter periplasmic adaptor subunit [Blastocatellia bacterium]|nr:HlyD family efflux transporter periplasmic adaptor subunit [Blastocatellia bacterium]